MTKEFPARLHVLFAKNSQMAVVIRRGPSKQVCTVSWNREDDTFEMGQWLKGRIYEKRCDLSPDGKYLLYFALNGRWDSEVEGAWTAISRAPWLKAVELYPKGDTWGGGGQFTAEKRFWLNGCHYEPIKQSDEVQLSEDQRSEDHFSVYEGGLLVRDGWKLSENSKPNDISPVFEKELIKDWILKKVTNAKFPDQKKACFDRHKHQLINKVSDTRLIFDDWEWADWDRDSLVWASKGCLYRAPIKNAETIGAPKLLYDFNPLKFERIKAPY